MHIYTYTCFTAVNFSAYNNRCNQEFAISFVSCLGAKPFLYLELQAHDSGWTSIPPRTPAYPTFSFSVLNSTQLALPITNKVKTEPNYITTQSLAKISTALQVQWSRALVLLSGHLWVSVAGLCLHQTRGRPATLSSALEVFHKRSPPIDTLPLVLRSIVL